MKKQLIDAVKATNSSKIEYLRNSYLSKQSFLNIVDMNSRLSEKSLDADPNHRTVSMLQEKPEQQQLEADDAPLRILQTNMEKVSPFDCK
jgi:hypothetical protein